LPTAPPLGLGLVVYRSSAFSARCTAALERVVLAIAMEYGVDCLPGVRDALLAMKAKNGRPSLRSNCCAMSGSIAPPRPPKPRQTPLPPPSSFSLAQCVAFGAHFIYMRICAD
jgi:hypothetical protein